MHHRFIKAVLVVLLVLVLASMFGTLSPSSAQAASSASWPQFLYGPQHTGFNPREVILDRDNVGALVQLWTQPVGQSIDGIPFGQPVFGTPAVSGGRVFVAGERGGLFAYRKSDGRLLWSADLGAYASNVTPVVFGNLVILAGGQYGDGGVVSAFDVRTGHPAWTRDLPDPVVLSTPALYGGRLYFGAGGTVYSLSASTGQVVWSRYVHGNDLDQNGIAGPVAVSESGTYVVAVTGDGNLFGVNRASGTIAWTGKIGGGVYRGGVSISGGIGYVANSSENTEVGQVQLYAFRVSDGQVLWHQDCGGDVHVTPTVGYGMVFNGAIDETVRAIDARTGEILWVAGVPGEVWASNAIANGVLYVGTESALLALDAFTGQELWQAVIGSGWAAMSSPSVTGGRVFVGTGEGEVLSFGLPQ